MVGTLNAITAAKEREEQLSASDQRFRHLADALPQIVWTCDGPDNGTYCNRRWREYTGLHQENALGDKWLEIIHPEDRKATLEAWDAATRTGEPYNVEHRILRADGSYRWLLSSALLVPQGKSGNALWFGTSRDIEDQKQLADSLRIGDRRKDDFVATLAHELRNPLAAISNAVQVMKAKRAAPGLVDIIDRQTSGLVADLLDASRLGPIHLSAAK